MSEALEPVSDLSGEAWAARERLIDRFEDAWQSGQRPALDDYLPAETAQRGGVLVELIHTDLECRLKAGEVARVEPYLQRYPELTTNRSAVVDLIVSEYRLRRRGDPALVLDEYCRRFPDYQADLQAHPAARPSRRAAASQEEPAAVTGAPHTQGPGRGRPPAPASRDLPTIPGYEVLDELGRGGMGVVYRARDRRLQRLVALKMILGGEHAGAQALARFRTEAEAVARLQHPNIVQIFAVDEHDGRAFLALEFVEGGSLAQRLAGQPQAPQPSAHLIDTLARAVHHAHERGIIHRDLKPSNILLDCGLEDRPSALPKITDFGLAKRLDRDSATTSGGVSQTGQVLGTPGYMAPEQADGKVRAIGPATDVYALGAILYELLTGRPPFLAETPLATLELVRFQEPVPPTRFQPRLPPDLQTICLKCLQKEPHRRYASAQDLADDLHRFQRGEPIQARPVGRTERVWRWCCRNPPMACLLAVLLVLLATVGNLTRLWLDQERWRHEIVTAAQREVFTLRGHSGSVLGVAYSTDGRWLASAGADRTVRLWDSATGKELRVLTGHSDRVTSVVFSPSGPTLASTSDDQTIRIWDANTGETVRTLYGHGSWVMSAAFSPFGERLASAALDERVKVWDATTGQELLTFRGHAGGVQTVAFSPDGQRIASAGRDQTIKVWDATTGHELLTLRGHGHSINRVTYSDDGRWLASASEDGTVKVWGAISGQERLSFRAHDEGVQGLAFSADGARLATAGGDRTVALWEAETGKRIVVLRRHTESAGCLAFHPDGHRLAAGCADRIVTVWSVGE